MVKQGCMKYNNVIHVQGCITYNFGEIHQHCVRHAVAGKYRRCIGHATVQDCIYNNVVYKVGGEIRLAHQWDGDMVTSHGYKGCTSMGQCLLQPQTLTGMENDEIELWV